MQVNMDQKNSKYGHILRGAYDAIFSLSLSCFINASLYNICEIWGVKEWPANLNPATNHACKINESFKLIIKARFG